MIWRFAIKQKRRKKSTNKNIFNDALKIFNISLTKRLFCLSELFWLKQTLIVVLASRLEILNRGIYFLQRTCWVLFQTDGQINTVILFLFLSIQFSDFLELELCIVSSDIEFICVLMYDVSEMFWKDLFEEITFKAA